MARLMRVPARLVETPEADDLSGDSVPPLLPGDAGGLQGRRTCRGLSDSPAPSSAVKVAPGKELVARAIYQHSSWARVSLAISNA